MADTKEITLGDLMERCRFARQCMSFKNPHRELVWDCMQIIMQLAERVTVAEAQTAPEPPKIELTD